MDFDGALMKTGGFGRFQTTLALVFLTTATAHFSFNHMAQVFILIVPEHYWCPVAASEGGGANSSFEVGFSEGDSWNGSLLLTRQTCRLELGIGAVDINGTTTEQCPEGWHYEYGDLYATMSTEHNWVCGDSWKQYVLHTTFWIGSMAGYVTSGFLADRFGRRVAIGSLSAVSALANLMPLFISQHWGLAVARLIAGMGAESVCSTIFVLVIEFTIPERRTLIGFVWAFSWTIMASSYPWYADLIQSWRGLVLTNSALSVAILVILWFVPESPSWHLTVGRRDEAVRTLTKIARVNGRREITEDDFKTLQIKTTEVAQSEPKRSFWKDTLAMVATPRLRRNTLVLFGGWFLICLVYNANTLELSHLGLNVYGTYSTAIAFELPVNLFTILALDRLGRRWPNVAFMFVGGIISLVMALLRTDSSAATLIMAVITIVCYAGGYNITYQLASEIFPTEIRGRGVLIKRLFGDIGSCLGADVAYLVEYDRYLPLLVMGVLSLLAALLLFFVPDTVHEPLPQTIEDGEEFAKDQGLCFCPVLVTRLPDRQDKERGDKSNGEPVKGDQEIVTHL
ncbi:solute carrier family 22 member 3 [Dermacentor silvarum]|uniref:solute carrier family 22 member 3 n=1 Tax=Dermacentor silvarum TaxID=543639 RepID=UPI001898166B|nr:solute carrier family 22 member 3 [Dermacentor silvarum]